jgi:hypothetical protein
MGFSRLHTAEVTGSSPVRPTIFRIALGQFRDTHRRRLTDSTRNGVGREALHTLDEPGTVGASQVLDRAGAELGHTVVRSRDGAAGSLAPALLALRRSGRDTARVAVWQGRRSGREARAARGGGVAFLAILATLCCTVPAWGAGGGAPDRRFWQCAPGREAKWLPAGVRGGGKKWYDELGRTLHHHSDLANAGLYLGAFAGVELGASRPGHPHWTSSAAFEDDARDDLVAGTKSGREAAATASDVLLGLTATAPVWLDVGIGSWLRQGDCETALEIFGETAEALTLSMLVTEATKLIAARERPYRRECALDPDYDDGCGSKDSARSFFSGHTSLASAAAGVLCRNTYLRERPVWGTLGRLRNPLPCALGVGAAVATGLLRIRADQHWLGDVLAGWAVGLAIGLFDLPGPVDLLSFRYQAAGHEVKATLLPSVGAGSVGARLAVVF